MVDDVRQKKNVKAASLGILFSFLASHPAWLTVAALSIDPISHASDRDNGVTNASKTAEFRIAWPLQVTAKEQDTAKLSLLHGQASVLLAESNGGKQALKIRITIERPSSEEQRLFWNSSLAYPNYSWMSEVRVWDGKLQWLWPNLTYLLRPFGTQKIDRYGGWDPGKQIDNDFAAVLMRTFDADGSQESSTTKTNPLVSAEWHAVGQTDVDAYTVVHKAISDEFNVTLCDRQTPQSGQIRVWLIYADFLGSPVPRGWPKEPEFNGGILKYFRIDWTSHPVRGCTFEMREETPPTSTRFDWKQWLNRKSEDSDPEAHSRLSD